MTTDRNGEWNIRQQAGRISQRAEILRNHNQYYNKSSQISPANPHDLVWFCDHYAAIRGSLTIGAGVTDLSGLSCLTEVQGDLTIYAETPNVALPKLISVGGSLLAADSTAVTADFSGLQTVGDT